MLSIRDLECKNPQCQEPDFIQDVLVDVKGDTITASTDDGADYTPQCSCCGETLQCAAVTRINVTGALKGKSRLNQAGPSAAPMQVGPFTCDNPQVGEETSVVNTFTGEVHRGKVAGVVEVGERTAAVILNDTETTVDKSKLN